MIELVNTLYSNGTLKELILAGLVSPKINFYRDVYLDYDKNIKTRKVSKTQAAIDTADAFRVQVSTVYRIIGIMKPK